jgi:hypothetical protein
MAAITAGLRTAGRRKGTRKLIGRYIEVYEYPDGRIELRADGTALPYATYDRLPEVEQGPIVENKRLGHVLAIAQVMQEQRDSRRGQSAPSRANQGLAPIPKKPVPGKKAQRRLDDNDLHMAIEQAPSKKAGAGMKVSTAAKC